MAGRSGLPLSLEVPTFVFAFAVMVVACTSRNPHAGKTPRSDSATVTVVRRFGLKDSTILTWTSRSLFSTRDNDSLQLHGTIDAVFVDDTGILVGNGAELMWVGPGGAVRRIGREGDGPGEFRAIFRLGVTADGSVFVGDLWSGRFTQVSPGGRVERIVNRLQLDDMGREIEPIAVLADGRILATLWQWRPNRGAIAGIAAGPFERDPVPLFVSSGERQVVDTLGVWPGLERAKVTLGGETARLPIPFARSAVYDGRGGASVIGTSDSLDLWLFEGTAPKLHLTGPSEHRRVSPQDRADWRRMLDEVRPDISHQLIEAERNIAEMPETPTVGGVVLDDRRNVWIGVYASSSEQVRRWYLFTSAGRPLGTMDLPSYTDALMPSRTELLDVRGDRLALLREDSTGALSIEVRSILRR